MKFPTYRSHKTVEAFQIGSITPQQLGTHDNTIEEPRLIDGIPVASKTEYLIVSEDGQYHAVVGDNFVMKHDPYIGGYFVRYKNGHESFSPADAFEDGHVQEGKRRMLHVTVGNSFSPTLEDIQMIMDMFKGASEDQIGAVVATIPEVNSYFVDVMDGPDFELVRVTLDDEPLVKDADGNPMVLSHAVDLRIEGATLPTADDLKRVAQDFAILLNNPEIEIDADDYVEEFNVEAFQDGNSNEVLISVLLKDKS